MHFTRVFGTFRHNAYIFEAACIKNLPWSFYELPPQAVRLFQEHEWSCYALETWHIFRHLALPWQYDRLKGSLLHNILRILLKQNTALLSHVSVCVSQSHLKFSR